jgi:hypothetical protein
LGQTPARRGLVANWLHHRAQLRAIGFDRGFQWLDGSFVEDKTPRDLDVVTFLYRPPGIVTPTQLALLMRANLNLFGPAQVKAAFGLDFFAVDLSSSPELLVSLTRYWIGLFSHRRDGLWKGMLEIRLENPAEDSLAQAALASVPSAAP